MRLVLKKGEETSRQTRVSQGEREKKKKQTHKTGLAKSEENSSFARVREFHGLEKGPGSFAWRASDRWAPLLFFSFLFGWGGREPR